MVGTIKSNGCDVCRKRRIKCDQKWPSCGQCQKSKWKCSGPPSRLKFVDLGAREFGITCEPQTCPQIESSDHSKKVIVLIRSKESKHGFFHKLRLRSTSTASPRSSHRVKLVNIPILPKPVSSNEYELLSLQLSHALSIQVPGYDLTHFSSFMQLLPPRIGRSKALDDAIACFMFAHQSLMKNGHPLNWIDPSLYGQALRSLQQAIADPAEAYSPNTLCATAIMQRLELAFNSSPVDSFVIHAGGLAKLLEFQGPPQQDDELAITITLESYGIMISYAIEQGKECFLSTTRWRKVCESPQPDASLRSLSLNFLHEAIHWPGLLSELQCLDLDPEKANATTILHRAKVISTNLQKLEQRIQQVFSDSEVSEVLSSTRNHLIPTAYIFNNPDFASILTNHAMYSIAIRHIISDLSPATALDSEIQSLSQRIWMTYEHCLSHEPLGCQFLSTALIITYRSATQAQREWILQALNELERFRKPITPIWTEELVLIGCMRMTGGSSS